MLLNFKLIAEAEGIFSYCGCYCGTTDGQGGLAFKLLHHDEFLREGFSKTALTSKISGIFSEGEKMSRDSLRSSYRAWKTKEVLRWSLMNAWIAKAKKKTKKKNLATGCKLKYERIFVLKPVSKNGQICTGFLLIMNYK